MNKISNGDYIKFNKKHVELILLTYRFLSKIYLLKSGYEVEDGYIDKCMHDCKKCTHLQEGSIEGVNSYLANYSIGIIYECLGYIKEAKMFYKKCGDYQLARE